MATQCKAPDCKQWFRTVVERDAHIADEHPDFIDALDAHLDEQDDVVARFRGTVSLTADDLDVINAVKFLWGQSDQEILEEAMRSWLDTWRTQTSVDALLDVLNKQREANP